MKKMKHCSKSCKMDHKHKMKKHAYEDGMEHEEHRSRVKKEKRGKIAKVMREYAHGELHSGSKKGPKVKSRAQALAIGYSEARRGKKK